MVREDAPAVESGEAAVLINLFEVAAGEDEAFVRAWERARDYLRGRPGYLDTRLHRSVLPGADFRFVNVARWESAGAFRAATESAGFQGVARMPYRAHPALYRVVRR